jgi:hypothetical protein
MFDLMDSCKDTLFYLLWFWIQHLAELQIILWQITISRSVRMLKQKWHKNYFIKKTSKIMVLYALRVWWGFHWDTRSSTSVTGSTGILSHIMYCRERILTSFTIQYHPYSTPVHKLCTETIHSSTLSASCKYNSLHN